MKVLVDTSVWSLALRRKESNVDTQILSDLIMESRVVIIGPIRQELLSGISNDKTFSKLKKKLKSFEDLSINTYDYEVAAEFYNTCRQHGVQGSHVDFLICAVACNNNLLIYTSDRDFENYARFLPIHLLHD